MSIPKVIETRRSVRTFEEKALWKEDADKIMTFAAAADNPYHLPIEWRLLDAKKDGLTSPVIVGTDRFIAGKLKRLPHAEEAFGYSFEKIVLYAESLRIGTTWIAGTMNRAAFEKAMSLREDEVMPCVSPLGYPAAKMSLRESMMRKGIKADSRIAFEKLFFDGSFEKPLTKEKAGKLADVFEAVRLAPSAVNKQPWRAVVCGNTVHFYEKQSGGYVSENGWDLQKIDLGIALCHFDCAAAENGLTVTFGLEDPKLASAGGMVYIASYTLS